MFPQEIQGGIKIPLQNKERKLISIVMPAMNEEENLPRAYKEVTEVFSQLSDYDYEVIVIDNDSTDRTADVCAAICVQDKKWKYVKFSRNFTSEISIAAGLRLAKGDAVIILFSDLQDPPRLIPKFIEKWEEGYDMVCGLLSKRADDTWWKTLGAKFIYGLLNRLSDIKIPPHVVDFRLMSRPVVNAINKLDERNRYFRGLSHWAGFKTCIIPYERQPRLKGKSAASFFYMIDFVLRALTSFSITPLRIFSGFGWILLGFAVVYMIISLGYFFFGHTVPGLTTVIILLLFNLAFISLGIGALGEYIGRIYMETKRRPLWVIEKNLNITISDEERFG
ncbi:MAG: glycosyltransferase family 2 protein [Nitrospirae bacterium]|nr:glycosyltransferase family 2 protein [Nitrospirota bacterium]